MRRAHFPKHTGMRPALSDRYGQVFEDLTSAQWVKPLTVLVRFTLGYDKIAGNGTNQHARTFLPCAVPSQPSILVSITSHLLQAALCCPIGTLAAAPCLRVLLDFPINDHNRDVTRIVHQSIVRLHSIPCYGRITRCSGIHLLRVSLRVLQRSSLSSSISSPLSSVDFPTSLSWPFT